MASIIRIKRSTVSGNPNVLAAGELAYSALSGTQSNGGDRLYIGIGTETSGNAANHFVIGGKYFTDRLDHTEGVLTANSAILVDDEKKIDNLKVDNLDLNGNTISTTDSNGNLVLDPNGVGKVSIANAYTLPRTDGTAGYGLITNGLGQVNFSPVPYTLSIAGDTGTDTVTLLSETLSVTGGEGIDVAVTDNNITISGEDASSTNKGVASFLLSDFDVTEGNVALKDSVVKQVATDSGTLTPSAHGFSILGGEGMDVTHSGTVITVSGEDASTTNKGVAVFDSGDFTVTDGLVSIKSSGVSNDQLVNSSVTFGTTTVSLGSTSTSIAGVTSLDVDNININGNTIGATDTNGDVVLAPNGTGVVSVSNKRITNLATPVGDLDAVNKAYVDNIAEGLHVHAPAKVATTGTLASLSGGTVTYNNGTNGIGATLTLSVALTSIDGWLLSNGDRVIVKDEVNKAHNGVYTWGGSGTVFTRATDFDTDVAIGGGDFIFTQEGNSYGNTGWVQTETATTIGTSPVEFQQFSGAGTYIAGAGLSLDGTIFNVNVHTLGGIEIVSDELQLKSTLAGDGLTYSNGVLQVNGTTDRITISADNIDIASTYEGQTSINTVGTITTGTWNADVVSPTYGGTGVNSYSIGDMLYASNSSTLTKLSAGEEGKVLQINASGVPVWADVDGGTY